MVGQVDPLVEVGFNIQDHHHLILSFHNQHRVITHHMAIRVEMVEEVIHRVMLLVEVVVQELLVVTQNLPLLGVVMVEMEEHFLDSLDQ